MTYLLQRAAAAKGSHRASATVGVNELTKTSRVLARELETGLCVVSFTPGEGDGEGAGAEGAGAEGAAAASPGGAARHRRRSRSGRTTTTS